MHALQAQAQAQAQQAAVEAHHLDAAAQQLQAEAQAVAAPLPILPASPDKPLGHLSILDTRSSLPSSQELSVPSDGSRGPPGGHHAFHSLKNSDAARTGQLPASLALEVSQEKLGPIVSLQSSLPLGTPADLQLQPGLNLD